jgi:arginine-tRNA-protein transferase
MTEGRAERIGGDFAEAPAQGRLLRLFATPPMACPYVEGLTERQVVTLLAGDDPVALHDRLTAAGFRRSYNIAYRPACEGCSACVPVRVRAADFRMTRSMRRVAARAALLGVATLPAKALADHYVLFHRYQKGRHADGAMADMEYEDFRAMIEDSPVRTSLVEFRRDDGRLFGVAITDRVADGLSMVYSFYDPDFEPASPGTAMILWHVERAVQLGLPHVYLGYWVQESPKMAYKARFKPIERLGPEGWKDLA